MSIRGTREARVKDLKKQVREAVRLHRRGELTQVQVQSKIAIWLKQPFQPDVADYFLNGPGKKEAPFNSLFKI